MLLLTGPAGAGKSVLTRYLVESVLSGSQNETTDNSYLGVSFFCSYNEAVSTSVEVVLRSLLHQLIQLNPHSGTIARSRLQNRDSVGVTTTSFKIDDLWTVLTDVLSMNTMRRLFLTIDAIEELGFEAAISILDRLLKLVQFLNSGYPETRLRIFVSSRYSPAYASALPGLTILPMDKTLLRRDIEQYVRHQINDFAAKNSTFRVAVSTTAGT